MHCSVLHMKNDTEHNNNCLFSLLEAASKPIDNDEEESYKAAFAGNDEFEEMMKLAMKTTGRGPVPKCLFFYKVYKRPLTPPSFYKVTM